MQKKIAINVFMALQGHFFIKYDEENILIFIPNNLMITRTMTNGVNESKFFLM